MTGNVLLAARMKAEGLKQHELADALNQRIASFTGRLGTLQDRHVRNWLTGKTKWPHARQRRALEEEFGCTAVELGFRRRQPRQAAHRQASVEESVKRRQFATSAGAISAVAALPGTASASTPRIGMTDVYRFESAFNQIVAADNARGGGVRLETRALSFAKLVTDVQANSTASQRVRQRLYYLAAAFTGSALWAAIEDQEPERANQHLDRATRLAGLSGNPDIQLRIWGHASMLATQTGNFSESLAACEAAKASPLCRRDPLYRSLTAARLASSQARTGERTQARRSLAVAAQAFEQADQQTSRAPWVAFYDRSELEGLSGLAMSDLGRHDQAEAHFHRALAHLRPGYERNRKYYTSHLALSQIRQGDVELAYTTASSVLPAHDEAPLTGRQRKLLTKFSHALATHAKDTDMAASWAERYADERNRYR
ncbi:hypothetical protein [Streptomyces sp. NPDC005955]|uniref:hypothetical protein n=1 Tax=Streptomyces sp. NPDC005955 TaxID=3364738 RepID=UPI0036AEDD06